MREARQLPGGLFACLSLEGPEVRMHPAAEVTSAFESNLFFFFASPCLRHFNWNWKLPPQWLLCPAYANLLINVSFPEAAIIPDIWKLILSRFNCLRCKHGYLSFRFGNWIQARRMQPKQWEPDLLSKYRLLRLKDHSALQPRLASNSLWRTCNPWSSFLYLPNAENSGMSFHAWFMSCWRLNPQLGACLAGALPTELPLQNWTYFAIK